MRQLALPEEYLFLADELEVCHKIYGNDSEEVDKIYDRLDDLWDRMTKEEKDIVEAAIAIKPDTDLNA